MDAPINIRVMTPNDYDSVYALWINTPGMGLNLTDDSREGIDKYIRRNPTSCFVAVQEDRVVGAILAGHDGRRGYIYHTAVAPDRRKRGVARRLTESAVEALEKEGIHKTALVVFKKNTVGNAFWESMGFTLREDIAYRNKSIHELERIDT